MGKCQYFFGPVLRQSHLLPKINRSYGNSRMTDRQAHFQDLPKPLNCIRIGLRSHSRPVKPGTVLSGTVMFESTVDHFQVDNIIVGLYGTCKSKIGNAEETHVLVKRFQDCTPSFPADAFDPRFVTLNKKDDMSVRFDIPLPQESFCPCEGLYPCQQSTSLPPTGIIGTADGTIKVEVRYQLIVRIKAVGYPRVTKRHDIMVGNPPRRIQRGTAMLEKGMHRFIIRETERLKIKLDKESFPPGSWPFLTASQSKVMIQVFAPTKYPAGETVHVRMFMLFSVPPTTFKKPAGRTTEAILMGQPDRRDEVHFTNCSIKMRHQFINLADQVVKKSFITHDLQHTPNATVNISDILPVKDVQRRTRLPFHRNVKNMYAIELSKVYPKFQVPNEMVQYASCGVGANEFSLHISGQFEVEMEKGNNQHGFNFEIKSFTAMPLVDVWN